LWNRLDRLRRRHAVHTRRNNHASAQHIPWPHRSSISPITSTAR
jgi:hypothetical protein